QWAVVSAGQPAPAALRQPPLDVLGDEPKRTILTAEPERRDPTGASRLVDPGAGDGEQASDVIRPQQVSPRACARPRALERPHAPRARLRRGAARPRGLARTLEVTGGGDRREWRGAPGAATGGPCGVG